jgi:hypothetical protein
VFVWYRLFFGVTILIGVALGRFSWSFGILINF